MLLQNQQSLVDEGGQTGLNISNQVVEQPSVKFRKCHSSKSNGVIKSKFSYVRIITRLALTVTYTTHKKFGVQLISEICRNVKKYLCYSDFIS